VGSIEPYQTAAGRRYRVRYRKPDHTQAAKRGFRTKRDAELYLASIELDKARGDFIDSSSARVTIGELAIPWLTGRLPAMKPSAYRPLEITWRLHVSPVWRNVRVGDVRHSAVQAWVSDLAKIRSATVTLRAYGILAGILDTAVRDRIIPRNNSRGVALPRKQKKSHVYLTHEEVEKLAKESGTNGTLVRTLAYTGIRWGEAVALRTEHIDLERRRLRIEENAVRVGEEILVGTPKSHKQRTVPVPPFLADELTELIADRNPHDLVFGSGTAYMRRPDQRKGWFAYAKKRARVPQGLTIHDLRHTTASLAVSAGANVKAVQRMLGHASAAMTLDVYADLFDDDLDAVSLALDHARLESDVSISRPMRDI
jgi:integrase